MPEPTFLGELGGLIAVVILVAGGTIALGRLDLNRVRRGHAPLGFVSDRLLEDVRRQAGDRPPSEYVGASFYVVGRDEVPAWRQLAELDLEAEEGTR